MIDNTKGPDGPIEVSGLTLKKLLEASALLNSNDPWSWIPSPPKETFFTDDPLQTSQ